MVVVIALGIPLAGAELRHELSCGVQVFIQMILARALLLLGLELLTLLQELLMVVLAARTTAIQEDLVALPFDFFLLLAQSLYLLELRVQLLQLALGPFLLLLLLLLDLSIELLQQFDRFRLLLGSPVLVG